MTETALLAQQFEEQRPHLRAVAVRMLGSPSEADDAVQEAWLRLSRAGADGIENLGGWLTTVVSRVCLDVLRARSARREEPLDGHEHGPATEADPEREALLADTVGHALLVVLETLPPAERVAFVLHDMFAVPFEEIAAVLGRSPAAARQLASRARRRVQGGDAGVEPDVAGRRAVVDAFLAASRSGDLAGLVALLDPGVVLRADAAAVEFGAEPEVLGADAVAATFSGRAKAARAALIDGQPGAVWSVGGRPRVVFAFTIAGGTIIGMKLIADPERLARLELS